MPQDHDRGDPKRPRLGESSGVSDELLRLLPRDVVFSMRFLGESQHRLQSHFQSFIRDRLEADGVTQQTHPLIHTFIDSHATLLRDFVFSGVALAHQFRVDEIERMTGDVTSIMRVDIWDQLKSHIAAAEQHFSGQIGSLQPFLAALEDPAGRSGEEP
ncbi:MAG: hypothetical protein KF914_03000 [Rhizobiaceae bacterium]|nr:hypothetical protein [Rhizobiaceae bacterium]